VPALAAGRIHLESDAHGQGALVGLGSRHVPNAQHIRVAGGILGFSVSKSQEPAVKKYIAGQAEHHKREDFKTELLRLLRAHEIEFDERYAFD